MEDERKLATVRVVSELKPIEGADLIELAIVDGWQCVVKKGEFNVGDKVIYCEIDSLLPIKPEYEFLRKSCYRKMPDGTEGFRVKSMRLRGQLSQGLLLPVLSLNSEEYVVEKRDGEYFLMEVGSVPYSPVMVLNEGIDVTRYLGIIKYELPIPANLAGLVKGNFPSFLRKTDEERIQNVGWVLGRFEDTEFYATEKIDGSSSTFYIKEGTFGVCSRNLELKETDDNTFWTIARTIELEKKMKAYKESHGFNFALQGETHGLGIQKNKYRLYDVKIRFFNMFNIDEQRFVDLDEFEAALKEMELEMVPIIYRNFKLPKTVNEVLTLAEGKSVLNKDVEREGLVFRPMKEMSVFRLGRLSFKAISNKFLLKFEE
jgi:RNA ligase (TIGR02306 family)